jgi:hypothetical protein
VDVILDEGKLRSAIDKFKELKVRADLAEACLYRLR